MTDQYTIIKKEFHGKTFYFFNTPTIEALVNEIFSDNYHILQSKVEIYPGDVIVIDRDADGNPLLRVQSGRLAPKVYAEQIVEAIPPIPPNVIEPFISAPLVVDADGLEYAARIVATQQDRVG